MKRPKEHEYTSHVAYSRALEAYCDSLEQPAQDEPVAWMVYTLDGKSAFVTDNPSDFTTEQKALPLYTRPQAREPLTDEQELEAFEAWCFSIGLMAESYGIRSESSHCYTAWEAWKARAAHGIKGEA